MLKENNQAETTLTVGGLKVLGSIDNTGLRSITHTMETLQQNATKTAAAVRAQQDYWTALSLDNVISPAEKPVLRNEWQVIQRTYTNIWNEAVEKKIEHTTTMQDYKTAYEELKEYLLQTLNIFGDMSESTKIDNRQEFNNFYSDYYNEEFKARSLIEQGTASGYQDYEFAIGTKDSHPAEDSELWTDAPSVVPEGSFLWARTAWVNSVGEHGTWAYFRLTGEAAPEVTAQYSMNGNDWHNTFVLGDVYLRMSYDSGQTWSGKMKIVGEDAYPKGYLGVYSSAADFKDDTTEQSFFLAGKTFTFTHIIMTRSDKILLANGKRIRAQRTFEKGYIYLYYNHVFHVIRNKNDYHYISASNDLLAMGETLSPEIQAYFDAMQEDITSAVKGEVKGELEDEIEELIPSYKGAWSDMSLIDKSSLIYDDWVLYIGTTTSSYTNGQVYVWNGSNAFTALDPSSPGAGDKYMSCMYDALTKNKNKGSSTFAPTWVYELVSSSIFTDFIETMTLIIKGAGSIRSAEVNETTKKGFYLNANGSGYLGGNVKIAGDISAASGSFKGDISAASGTFKGNIESNNYNPSTKTGYHFGSDGSGFIGGNVVVNGDISGANGTFSGEVQVGNYNAENGTGARIFATGDGSGYVDAQFARISQINGWKKSNGKSYLNFNADALLNFGLYSQTLVNVEKYNGDSTALKSVIDDIYKRSIGGWVRISGKITWTQSSGTPHVETELAYIYAYKDGNTFNVYSIENYMSFTWTNEGYYLKVLNSSGMNNALQTITLIY